MARLGPQVPSPLLVQSRCWISLREVPTPCCCSLHRDPAPSTSPLSWQPSQVSRLVSNSERAVAQAQKDCRAGFSCSVFLSGPALSRSVLPGYYWCFQCKPQYRHQPGKSPPALTLHLADSQQYPLEILQCNDLIKAQSEEETSFFLRSFVI